MENSKLQPAKGSHSLRQANCHHPEDQRRTETQRIFEARSPPDTVASSTANRRELGTEQRVEFSAARTEPDPSVTTTVPSMR